MIIKNIIFNPIPHTYTDEDGSIYIPVTKKIELVTPKFDEDYWAGVKARERGVPKEVVLKEWKVTRELACDKGNSIHETAEDSFNDSSFDRQVLAGTLSYRGNKNPVWGYLVNMDILRESNFAKMYPRVITLIEKYIKEGWLLYSEKRIYSVKYLIAGTIDLLLVKGNNFIIVDWKTNKDILRFESGYYKKVGGVKTNIWVKKNESMLAPLTNLPNCKGIGYTLQLSLYAYLCELWGYTCRGLILCHLKATYINKQVRTNGEVEIYTIKYLKSDIHKLVNYDFNKVRKPKFELSM